MASSVSGNVDRLVEPLRQSRPTATELQAFLYQRELGNARVEQPRLCYRRHRRAREELAHATTHMFVEIQKRKLFQINMSGLTKFSPRFSF